MVRDEDVLTIAALSELLVLQRALMEARFARAPQDGALWGSPDLASLHRRVVATIINIAEESGRETERHGWQTWLEFRSRSKEREIILERIREEVPVWSGWSDDRRRAFLQIVTAPFDVTPEDFDSLIAELNDTGL